MIRKCIKLVSKMAGQLIVMSITGFLLLCVVFMCPTGKIRKNVAASVDVLKEEGTYFSLASSIQGTQVDNFTEALYLNQAMINGQQTGVVRAALSGFTLVVNENDGPVDNIIRVIDEENMSKPISTHSRFWNGYTVVVKVLLAFFNYSEIRIINIYTTFSLILIISILLYKRGLKEIVLPFVITMLFLCPVTTSVCMTLVGFLYCTLIPCLLMLLFNDWLREKYRYIFFFELIGGCAFYFNMNYYQIISLGIPLVLFFVLNEYPTKMKELLNIIVSFCFAWLMGYFGTMILKWLIYAITFEPKMFRDMHEWARERTSTTIDDLSITRIDAIRENILLALQNRPWNFLEAGYVVWNILGIIKNKFAKFQMQITEVTSCVIIGLIPFVRYILMANHVYIHNFVTYRILAILVFAVNVLIARMNRSEQTKEDVYDFDYRNRRILR